MENLDDYMELPPAMKNYLRHYGWHFSKEMCEWAVSKMRKLNKTTLTKEKLQSWNKEQVEDLLKKYGITIENMHGYDHVYLANMAKADYLGGSIADELHLALFVKDVMGDVDGYSSKPFVHFYADCCHKGIPIYWEDML